METQAIQIDYWDAHALLEWQVELGISEAISESPVNRFEVPEKAPKPAAKLAAQASGDPITEAGRPMRPPVAKAPEIDAADVAHHSAAQASSVDQLQAALLAFEHCDLRRGARNAVFADGAFGARVMVIDDAPSRDEDVAGKPFAGASGALFDKMFAAIDLSRSAEQRENGLYLSAALPWRPPENRDPSPEEIAMIKPFLLKHIALANPDIIVLMGNHACAALLGHAGVTRLRGQWKTVAGKPALPMISPRTLLRTPIAKREAWADLLELQAHLRKAT